MVRTRAALTKKNVPENSESQDLVSSSTKGGKSKKLLLSDFKKQAEEQILKLETCLRCDIETVERHYDTLMLKYGPYGDMPFLDFINSGMSKSLFPEVSEELPSLIESKGDSSSGCPGFATSTVRKLRDSPPTPPSPPQRVTRQSRQRSNLSRSISENNINLAVMHESTMSKKPRRTRSVSIKRQDATFTSSKFLTPTNAAAHFPRVVTPKADPSTALRRHPRKGEFALSLTGSPLMVNSTNAEMNITLPVGNGEVYSILPTEQFNAGDIIPALSNDTRRQILLLRKNLDRLLGK